MSRQHAAWKRTNRWHSSSCSAAAAVLWFVAGLEVGAQWSLTQLNMPVAEDFSMFTAPSTWATAEPAANQLDSDIWGFSQTSQSASVSGVFGLNYIFGNGVNTGGVSSVGVYAIETGTGVKGIGPQADNDAWSPGNLTIKLQNDTGSEIEKLRVEWSYLVYNDQSGSRVSQLLISDTDANGSYLAIATGGTLVTQDAPQPLPSWIIIPREVTFDVNVPEGDEYYLRWSFTDLAGSEGSGANRDEVGIGNLQITPIVSVLGDYSGNGEIDAADYTVWRDALTASATELLNDPTPGVVDESDFLYWRDHFGETIGGGASAGSAAAVPEPATLTMLLMALLAMLSRRARKFHKLVRSQRVPRNDRIRRW